MSTGPNRLSLRLVLASVLIGSVLSIFSTGAQLYTSFERQKSDAHAEMDRLETAMAPSLAKSLWEFNFAQVSIILDGLITDESIGYVELNSTTGQSWNRGVKSDSLSPRQYQLFSDGLSGEKVAVGQLNISVSLHAVKDRVWAQFWTILASSMLKAYLSAFALIYVVHFMVIRHLHKIAIHIDDSLPIERKTTLRLDRKNASIPDDLEKIAHAFNEYGARVSTYIDQLQTEISGRKAAEAEVIAKSTFLATMSHEIRTPLNSILGLFQLIETGKDVPERHKTQAATGYKAAQRLLEQLVNVIDVSRLDAEAIKIRTRPTSIRQLAEQWEETTNATVFRNKKDITVTLDVATDLHQRYHLDGARLSQIINNLADNATKFTRSGEIAIRIQRQKLNGGSGHGLLFSVLDTGIGIDPNQADLVFHRFTQLDSSMTRQHGGSGLGLSICKELADLMGASLTHHTPDSGHFKTEFQLAIKHDLTMGCLHEKT